MIQLQLFSKCTGCIRNYLQYVIICFWIGRCKYLIATFVWNVLLFSKQLVTSISLYQLVLLDALQLAAGATGLFSQGVTAVVHGCSVRALGPRVNLTCSCKGGNRCHLWLSRLSGTEYTAEGTLAKGHKQAAFPVRFIEIPVLERGVVSQQYNGTQYTNPNSGMQIHKTLSQSINQQ